MDELTQERIAKNDARFREANEQIEAAAAEYGVDLRVPFLCECADRGCHAIVRMSREQYAEVRSDPRHFFNAPGHEEGDQEAAIVVAERDGYVIVRKLGRASDVAEELERSPDLATEYGDEVPRDRATRIGLNEALFREVNERVHELSEEPDADVLTIVCECGAENCTAEVRIERSAYAEMRSDPAQFAVQPGHEAPDVEDVVERREGYDVVRKRPGVPEKIAEETA